MKDFYLEESTKFKSDQLPAHFLFFIALKHFTLENNQFWTGTFKDE